MIKILRAWLRVGRPARVAYGRTIADNLAKTPPPLANPNPPLVDFEALTASAEAKMAKIKDLEQQLAAARQDAIPDVDALAAAMETMARRCEDVFADDPAGAISVGFEVAGTTPAPSGGYGMPQDFATTMNDSEGAIDWHCTPERGATAYELETTPNPVTGPWTRQESSTRSSGTITGLPSGTRIYVRVRANGPKGPGPWSDVSDRMVP